MTTERKPAGLLAIEFLEELADKFNTGEYTWTQGTLFRGLDGRFMDGNIAIRNPYLVHSMCLMGGHFHLLSRESDQYTERIRQFAYDMLDSYWWEVTGVNLKGDKTLTSWQDKKGRTVGEIVALLRQAHAYWLDKWALLKATMADADHISMEELEAAVGMLDKMSA